MPSQLMAIAGPLSGTPLLLTAPEISVGRDAANHLTLPDPSVSPRHCLITRVGARLTIVDLDPGNPTFVNGLPAGDRTLEDGDEIQIGGSMFVLQLADPEEGDISGGVRVQDGPALPPATIVMRREDVFTDAPFHRAVDPARVSRDLAALIRASGAITASADWWRSSGR